MRYALRTKVTIDSQGAFPSLYTFLTTHASSEYLKKKNTHSLRLIQVPWSPAVLRGTSIHRVYVVLKRRVATEIPRYKRPLNHPT